MYRIIVDSNNYSVIHRLLYFLYRENVIQQQHDFVLEHTIPRPPNSTTLLFIPIHPEGVVVMYNDFPITIRYQKTKESSHFHSSEFRYDQYTILSDHSFEHLSDFLDMIQKINISEESETILSKYIWKHEHEEWLYARVFPKRSLDSIYLHEKQKVMDTLEQFLNDSKTQAKYESLGIPYKKIFLFHGLPGTGKTSFIQALASHFNYHLSIVQTLPKTDDTVLERMISNLRKRTFLVFEDIDTLVSQRETSHKTSMTFGGILNMLDGIGQYDKLVVFITTNVLQQIAPAFRRRIDLFVEFGYMQKTDILEMYQKFFDDTSVEQALVFYQMVKFKKLTANTLEKFFIHCMTQHISPETHIEFLDEYNTMVSEKNIEHLYR